MTGYIWDVDLFKVKYDDGDEEELTLGELEGVLLVPAPWLKKDAPHRPAIIEKELLEIGHIGPAADAANKATAAAAAANKSKANGSAPSPTAAEKEEKEEGTRRRRRRWRRCSAGG